MKPSDQYAALELLGTRLKADFGAECTLETEAPMLDVRLRGELLVVDYDNGPDWPPRNQYRVAHVTDEYGFNMSNDPTFDTLALAEEFLRERLKQLI